MLTPEQKQAGFALRTRDLSRDEVFQKLKILDPEIREPGNFRLVGVDSDEFSHVFAKALVDSQARDIIVPLFQASGMNVTKREMVFLKYAVGDDPDNINLNKLIEEYRSSDVPMQESEIFLEQLKIMRTFAKNASDKQLGD